MFGLFKGKSEIEKLQDKYKKMIAEAHRLSTINRTESDQKTKEADDILKQIEAIQAS